MPQKGLLLGLPIVVVLALIGGVIAVQTLGLVSVPGEEGTESQTSSIDRPIDNRWVPERHANECVMPHSPAAYQTDDIILGGEPTGGLTWGWAIEDAGAGTTGRTILADESVHGYSAVDVAAIKLDERQPIVRAYSTIHGTVVDHAIEAKAEKPGYGAFAEIRNTRFACVANQPVWRVNSQHLIDKYELEEPALYFESDDDSISDQDRRVATCRSCERDGEAGCLREMDCPHDADSSEGDICPAPQCDLGDDSLPEGIHPLCEWGDPVEQRPPDFPPQRAILDELSVANFMGNTMPDLGYGKIANYQIDLAHMDIDKVVEDCQTGDDVSNRTYCGVMGSSGEDGADSSIIQNQMLHYAVWFNPKEALDNPDTYWRIVNNMQDRFMGNREEPVNFHKVPAPCCPPLEIPFAVVSEDPEGLTATHSGGKPGQIVATILPIDNWVEPLEEGLRVTYRVELMPTEGAATHDAFLTIRAPGAVQAEFWGNPMEARGEGVFYHATAFFGGRNLRDGQSATFDIAITYAGHTLSTIEDAEFGLMEIGQFVFGEDNATHDLSALSQAQRAEIQQELDDRRRLCRFIDRLDRADGASRQYIPQGPMCTESVGSVDSCLQFTGTTPTDTPLDLLAYFAPGVDAEILLSSGETIRTERVPELSGREGFVIHKNDYREEFNFDDDHLYHVQDTTWATGANQNVQCEQGSDAAFKLFDGDLGVTDQNMCSVFQSEQDSEAGQGGKWVSRQMQIGDEFVSNTSLFAINKETSECCNPVGQAVGARSHTMRLVSRGPVRLCSGLEFDDVIRLAVVDGAGMGENFYYARGIGWIGFERREGDPITGRIAESAMAYAVKVGDRTIENRRVALGVLEISTYQDWFDQLPEGFDDLSVDEQRSIYENYFGPVQEATGWQPTQERRQALVEAIAQRRAVQEFRLAPTTGGHVPIRDPAHAQHELFFPQRPHQETVFVNLYREDADRVSSRSDYNPVQRIELSSGTTRLTVEEGEYSVIGVELAEGSQWRTMPTFCYGCVSQVTIGQSEQTQLPVIRDELVVGVCDPAISAKCRAESQVLQCVPGTAEYEQCLMDSYCGEIEDEADRQQCEQGLVDSTTPMNCEDAEGIIGCI